LKRFGERVPASMLLNTSFNLFGEPLVLTPRDALRSYFGSGLDALIIDAFVLSKATVPSGNSAPSTSDHSQLSPMARASNSLDQQIKG
jgi:hypothetical protein